MMSLKYIIEKMTKDAEDSIPAMLLSAGLDDFDEYVEGPSRKENNKSLCVMFDPEIITSVREDRFSILIYLQLFKTNYQQALLYSDVVSEFIKNYTESNIGMTYKDSVTIDIIPIEKNSHTLIYISVTFINPLDSCDG